MKLGVIELLIIYIGAMNILGFLLMGIDKYKARKRSFRIPEATLFTIALFGGSIGSLVGMYFFKHKTRHKSFVYGLPGILFIHIILVILLFVLPIEVAIL